MADKNPSQSQIAKKTAVYLDMDELSTTLIERRKRLHELASEINQWEDEETRKLAHATAALMNQSPSTANNNNTTMNNTTTFAVSPSPRLGGLRQTSPSPHHYHLTPNSNNNKENRTPTNNNSFVGGKATAAAPITPGSNEIMSVAKRILTQKKQSNSEPPQSSHTVKSIASKFENLTTNSTDESSVIVQEKLTPRSIIQKFEKMAAHSSSGIGGGSAHSALNNGHKKPSENNIHKVLGVSNTNQVNTPKQWMRHHYGDIDDNDEDVEEKEERNEKGEERVAKPRSIIEKFESLVQQQGHAKIVLPTNTREKSQASGPSPASTHTSNSTSLTYVSSVMGETAGRGGSTNEYCDYDQGRIDEAEETSLFEDDDDDDDDERRQRHVGRKRTHGDADDDEDDQTSVASTFTNTTDSNRESSSYSISGSSYTAEILNQEEFDDVDDDYDSIDDEELDSNVTNQAQETDVETTITTASTSESQSSAPSSAAVLSSAQESTQQQQQQQQQPLMSLKDYRKQTKTFRSGCGRRRSSIIPANGFSSQNQKAQAPNSRDRKKNHLPTIGEASSSEADTNRIAKYSERIKELEEFIKQEDNSIRQTKDAIECCLNDPQFTGSAQHIECNRLMLISCQKKQAYMTEANRMRALINNKQSAQTSSSDISTSDLTGLLIFSDLQLPIKESFLNKVKAGEDKRQYYFICLIRNGIQVLQTQVISTQELVAANESSIIFPNRMAINNVDINFRIKIDIYEMEIQPKDQQPTKRGKNSSHHHQSKFFVSPFKTSNLSQVIHNTLGGGHSSSIHHGSSSNKAAASIGAKTSNFIHIDTVEITKKDLNTNNNLKFKLNLSSSSIPLMGVLSLSVRCMPSKSIELKGFMTLFEEDATGLGTWDRRWCFLNNQSISFWKYPEDEYRSGPLGTILLTMCVNEAVSILPRDLCARKHAIELLICVPTDDTVVEHSTANPIDHLDLSKCKRYRLSADTKEQANDWITNINYALANLRLWNPKALKPIKK